MKSRREIFLKQLSNENVKEELIRKPQELLRRSGISLDEALLAFEVANTSPGVVEDCTLSCDLQCSGSSGSKTGTVKGNVYP